MKKEPDAAVIVTITCIELKEMGYPTKDAYSLINELTAYLPFTRRSKYIKVTRNGKEYDHLQDLRVLSAEDIIRGCDEKIAKKKLWPRININKWQQLRGDIIEYQLKKESKR